MSGGDPDHDAFTAEIPSAFQRWARTVFGAPRRPQDLITDVQSCDEVIERLVTQVTRREIREVRTGTRERRSTASRLDPSSVDPFAFSAETLRVESQYIAQCRACAASGMMQCDTCRGSCTVACGGCGGTGKQRSEKTNRPINCKLCKKIGRVPCGACTATGSVACRTCSGSGHQLAWLAFDESQYSAVSVSPPQSPIVLAHTALNEDRPLSHDELSAFSIVEEKRSQGAIEPRDLGEPYRQLPRAQEVTVDPRLERIQSQQYLRLAIVRRDVTYEMCGTSGTVALSGKSLLGATTADAIRPIRRRLYAWSSLLGLVLVVGVLLRAAFVGSSSYFSGARSWSGILVTTATACAVPAFGALLRAWRGGARFRKLSRPALAAGGGAALALLGVVIVGLVVRPSSSEVQEALAEGDVVRARVILEALRERTDGDGVLELDDRVLLAEAGKQIGQDRLKLLDRVANRKGTASAEAATAARNERLSQIQNLVKAKDARTALAALDEWFRGDTSIEVYEERARAHEVALAQCTIDACRLAAAIRANAARASSERAAQVDAFRARTLDALATDRVDPKATTLARLRQLRGLSEAGSQTLKAITEDADVKARADAAIAFADAERAKVPLLRADLDVVEELLGSRGASETGAPTIDLRGAHAYLALDAAKKCTGIYVVGATSSNRALKSDAWPVDRLLSQAMGKMVKIKQPAELATTTQWYEGGYVVIARWRLGEVVELRMGDATP